MDAYGIVDGWNNAAGLVALDPQPASDGILYAQIEDVLSGHAYRDGRHTIWRFGPEASESQIAAFLTAAGLAAASSNEVTVSTNAGGDRATWANYNAIIKPIKNLRYRQGYYRDSEFMVLLVEAL